jgi:hypothetical protein
VVEAEKNLRDQENGKNLILILTLALTPGEIIRLVLKSEYQKQ